MNIFAKLMLPCLIATAATAQQELPVETDEQEELRRYQVEVVIFAYADEVGVGTEYFPPDEIANGRFGAPIVLEELIDEFVDTEEDEAPLAEDPSADAEQPEPPFVLLDEDELTIGNVIDQLERLSVYEPLMFFGWRQLTFPDEEPQARRLRDFGEPPERLEGSLTLYLSRYLHLLVDLELAAPPETPAQPESPADTQPVISIIEPQGLLGIEETGPLDAGVFYRIREDRILKNGDIRYFDHPKFGVIAKMMRIEDAPEEEEEAAGLRPLVLLPDDQILDQ
jgi:hypothetical protein